jgi:hypothetical protein
VKLHQFRVGSHFYCGSREWRCTDIGTRAIVAIRVDRVELGGENTPAGPRTLSKAEAEAEGWFNGPPYAVAEHLFDEEDQKSCAPADH